MMATKRPSRAAVYAMRTALLASAASAAVACGGLGTEERDGNNASMLNGKGGAVASTGSGQGGSAAQAGTAPGSSGAAAGATAANDDNRIVPSVPSDEGADPDPPDGGFAPVPIYGGAFPDPMSRARV
jgi:hypothetical protein